MLDEPKLFDTNILIDYLQGVPAAKVELESCRDRAISIVTWIELVSGARRDGELRVRTLLESFQIVMIDFTIAERCAHLRRDSKIKFADAMILATADTTGRLLVTRNTRDFSESSPNVRVPYRL